MTKFMRASAILIGAAIIAAPVFAGEIKGPPPTGNTPSPPNSSISNGNSLCSFSGLNDTPDGLPNIDPGGQVQSFGYFMSQFGLYDPSDPAQRNSFAFPHRDAIRSTRSAGTRRTGPGGVAVSDRRARPEHRRDIGGKNDASADSECPGLWHCSSCAERVRRQWRHRNQRHLGSAGNADADANTDAHPHSSTSHRAQHFCVSSDR